MQEIPRSASRVGRHRGLRFRCHVDRRLYKEGSQHRESRLRRRIRSAVRSCGIGPDIANACAVRSSAIVLMGNRRARLEQRLHPEIRTINGSKRLAEPEAEINPFFRTGTATMNLARLALFRFFADRRFPITVASDQAIPVTTVSTASPFARRATTHSTVFGSLSANSPRGDGKKRRDQHCNGQMNELHRKFLMFNAPRDGRAPQDTSCQSYRRPVPGQFNNSAKSSWTAKPSGFRTRLVHFRKMP